MLGVRCQNVIRDSGFGIRHSGLRIGCQMLGVALGTRVRGLGAERSVTNPHVTHSPKSAIGGSG